MSSRVESSLASALNKLPSTFIFAASDLWDMFGIGLGVGHLKVKPSGLQMILALARPLNNYCYYSLIGRAALTVVTQMRIRSLRSASIAIAFVVK